METIKMRNNRAQYCAILCCNLLTMSFGAICAWTSVNYLILQSDKSPVATGKLTLKEASTVVSILTFGGVCGNIVFGASTEKYGQKIPLMCAAIPQFISWLLILWAKNFYYLLVGRFLAGFAGGAVYVIIPLFISKIADDNIRGTLGSLINLTCNLGMVVELVLANYVSYATQAKIFLAVSTAFVLLFQAFPESPDYLLSKGKIKAAEKSSEFYGKTLDVKKEIPLIGKHNETTDPKIIDSADPAEVQYVVDEAKLALSDFTNRLAIRSIGIALGLVMLIQFSGCYVLLNYSVAIFTEAGSNLSPNESAIVIGIIQILGSYVSVQLADKAGRKFLLVVSASGTCLGLFILGIYNYMKILNYSMTNLGSIPLASFSFVIFISNCGILSLPFTVITEVLPLRIRSIVTSTCMTLMWLLAFFVIGSYPLLAAYMGLHGSLFIYSFCCLLGTIFVLLYIPETKGKSYEAIAQILDKRK